MSWDESQQVRSESRIEFSLPVSHFVPVFYTLERILREFPETQESDWNQHGNGGGYVHKDSTVHPSAFLAAGCLVFGETLVGPKARIFGNSKIGRCSRIDLLDSIKARGTVEIYQSVVMGATVFGHSTVQNSHISGRVWLQGDVIVKNTKIDAENGEVIATSRLGGGWVVISDSEVRTLGTGNTDFGQVHLRKSKVLGSVSLLGGLKATETTFSGDIFLKGRFDFRGPLEVTGEGSYTLGTHETHIVPTSVTLTKGREFDCLGFKTPEEIKAANRGFFGKLPSTGTEYVNPETEFTHE